jgi:hypothetical protein
VPTFLVERKSVRNKYEKEHVPFANNRLIDYVDSTLDNNGIS